MAGTSRDISSVMTSVANNYNTRLCAWARNILLMIINGKFIYILPVAPQVTARRGSNAIEIIIITLGL